MLVVMAAARARIRVLLDRRLGVERVIAVGQVVPRAAGDRVAGAALVDQRVVAGAALEQVPPALAVEGVRPGAAGQDVIAQPFP